MQKPDPNGIYDIAVVGGGPSGRIAALTFAMEGFSTVLLAPAAGKADGRTTALWQQSVALLQDIGIWPEIEEDAAPLEKMRMIDDTGRLVRAPEVVFDSAELGLECFGFNLLNSNLNKLLEKKCEEADGLHVIEDAVEGFAAGADCATLETTKGKTVRARLVVAADGRHSALREAAHIGVKRWSYPQVAVVLNLEHSLPHRNVSTEFHTPTGPFTLVPLQDRASSLVCVETQDGAQRLMELERDALERELERRAHSIFGKVRVTTDPQSFPLSGLSAKNLVSDRLALIGETAHVFPPIGAQGLNLSLRDIRDLSQTLLDASVRSQDIAAPSVLAGYERKRFADIRSRTNAVDALNRSLLTGFLPVQVARSAGMYLAGRVGPFRRLLMREGLAPGTGFRLRP